MKGVKLIEGVTLIELVITIVILGILGAISATILVPAFDAYFASQRRAELADTADAAQRRIARDLRLALPNSPRVDPTNRFLEVLLTKNGGRYRSTGDSLGPATTEDPLDFGAVPGDTVFDTLGRLANGADQQVQVNDYVVIHNLGITGANAYDTGAANPNIVQIAGFGAGALANEDRITLAANNGFPLDSPGRRFFVVQGPVTYACVGGSLRRWSGYAIQLRGGLPPTTLPAGATEAILANNLSACELTYTSLAQVSRGLVGMRVTITQANESVNLYYEAHVSNVP
jgi:MSHA biogenesis protein MshO